MVRSIWSRLLHLAPGANLGRRGEREAARYLARQGLRLLERNARVGRGELDLVAIEGAALVFVEVKSRTGRADDDETGRNGLERIHPAKLRILRQACGRYRRPAGARFEGARLDAITVEFEPSWLRPRVREVKWYRGIVDLG